MWTDIRKTVRLTFFVISAFTVFTAEAQSPATVNELIRETLKSITVREQHTMVWWLPQEYWQTRLLVDPNGTEEGMKKFLDGLEDYQLFILIRAKVRAAGLYDVQSKEQLISHSKLVVNGMTIDPIPDDKLPPMVLYVINNMKPGLANVLGEGGQSMQIVAYPSKRSGARLTDPTKEGMVYFSLYDQSFKWRLPLATLLPKKIDQTTKEEFPGNYLYNPFTGTKL